MPIRAGSTPVVLKSGRRSGVKVGGQGAVAFTPTAISGLVGWWDASDATTLYTDAGTTKVTADGDAVRQANDKGTNGYNLAQATAGSRPLYKTATMNGLSCLRCDGVDDSMLASAPSATAISRFFVVRKNGALAATDQTVVAHKAGGNASLSTNSIAGTGYQWIAPQTQIGGTPTSVQIVALVMASAATITFYVGGTLGATFDPHDDLSISTDFRIGSNWAGSSSFGDYDYGELIFYDSALSSANLNRVGNYLASKWSVTWTTVP